MIKLMSVRQRGIAQILVTLGMAILVLAIPLAVKLVEQRQEIRSKAACNSQCLIDCRAEGIPESDCQDACCPTEPPCIQNGGNCADGNCCSGHCNDTGQCAPPPPCENTDCMHNCTVCDGIPYNDCVQRCSGPVEVCGDGYCVGNENCSNCATDCGSCPHPPSPSCTEDCGACSGVCGNGVGKKLCRLICDGVQSGGSYYQDCVNTTECPPPSQPTPTPSPTPTSSPGPGSTAQVYSAGCCANNSGKIADCPLGQSCDIDNGTCDGTVGGGKSCNGLGFGQHKECRNKMCVYVAGSVDDPLAYQGQDCTDKLGECDKMQPICKPGTCCHIGIKCNDSGTACNVTGQLAADCTAQKMGITCDKNLCCAEGKRCRSDGTACDQVDWKCTNTAPQATADKANLYCKTHEGQVLKVDSQCIQCTKTGKAETTQASDCVPEYLCGLANLSNFMPTACIPFNWDFQANAVFCEYGSSPKIINSMANCQKAMALKPSPTLTPTPTTPLLKADIPSSFCFGRPDYFELPTGAMIGTVNQWNGQCFGCENGVPQELLADTCSTLDKTECNGKPDGCYEDSSLYGYGRFNACQDGKILSTNYDSSQECQDNLKRLKDIIANPVIDPTAYITNAFCFGRPAYFEYETGIMVGTLNQWNGLCFGCENGAPQELLAANCSALDETECKGKSEGCFEDSKYTGRFNACQDGKILSTNYDSSQECQDNLKRLTILIASPTPTPITTSQAKTCPAKGSCPEIRVGTIQICSGLKYGCVEQGDGRIQRLPLASPQTLQTYICVKGDVQMDTDGCTYHCVLGFGQSGKYAKNDSNCPTPAKILDNALQTNPAFANYARLYSDTPWWQKAMTKLLTGGTGVDDVVKFLDSFFGQKGGQPVVSNPCTECIKTAKDPSDCADICMGIGSATRKPTGPVTQGSGIGQVSYGGISVYENYDYNSWMTRIKNIQTVNLTYCKINPANCSYPLDFWARLNEINLQTWLANNQPYQPPEITLTEADYNQFWKDRLGIITNYCDPGGTCVNGIPIIELHDNDLGTRGLTSLNASSINSLNNLLGQYDNNLPAGTKPIVILGGREIDANTISVDAYKKIMYTTIDACTKGSSWTCNFELSLPAVKTDTQSGAAFVQALLADPKIKANVTSASLVIHSNDPTQFQKDLTTATTVLPGINNFYCIECGPRETDSSDTTQTILSAAQTNQYLDLIRNYASQNNIKIPYVILGNTIKEKGKELVPVIDNATGKTVGFFDPAKGVYTPSTH